MNKLQKPNKSEDFDVSNMVMGRLWKTTPFSDPILALEVIGGPYKGVVFSYKTFHVLPITMEGGFVPTKYETEIHVIPEQLPKNWVPDEPFDLFTSEVLFKWLSYINLNNLAPFLRMKTHGVQ